MDSGYPRQCLRQARSCLGKIRLGSLLSYSNFLNPYLANRLVELFRYSKKARASPDWVTKAAG